VERSTAQAERRFVTILFADLSGFTALSETLDPEAVRDIINACFDRLVPLIEAHQGTVDQFVGDAIVALFGAPVAHEDDPAQACRAALALLDAIAAVNVERGLDLGLHIGINSGTVVSGGVGSRGRQQYSVLGDAVNLAARLQDAAERGEIFVGAETERLTRGQFEFVARGEMPFKGKSEPQPVFQLVAARGAVRTHRPLHTLTPLFGRARELALLQRITRESADESGLRVVSILGEAGLGKSRLLQEWRAAVTDNTENEFVVAGCAPDSNLRAYALLADVARVLEAQRHDAAAGPSLALLRGISQPVTAVGEMDASALQAQYVNALRDVFAQRAAHAAIVLVCEDLHWADAPSCQVLRRVLNALPDARVLFCATLRPERETAGWELMDALQELPGAAAVRIHLAPLSEQDAQAMVSQLAPGDLPPEVRELVLAQAEGNPLFVEELVGMLIERGDLKRDGEQWVLTRELVALDVPNTLQGVLMARVDQLPPDARQLLQIASVLGREFPLEILERVAAALREPA
jgi:class 3 adenylate cyclase